MRGLINPLLELLFLMTQTRPVITRFAPSPTGFLHIGGARTALFNWLFARHHGGAFLLRIEDTDRERSTQAAIDAIIEGMAWLGLEADAPPVFQFALRERHAEVARQLLATGKAYHCYCTQEELEEMRETARAQGKPPIYNGLWRDRDPAEAPAGVPPVVRIRTPQTGDTIVDDQVLGSVTFNNAQLDDFVLLRSDGTPTYMLSVVVDDYDMAISHVIRGDDHFTNTARQLQIYRAMGWPEPVFAHLPMILGPDGAKLSKRHGALGVDAYRDMGYLPDAMRNYLLRLGWAHGDDEIISTEQAIEWFDLGGIGKSAARFDFAKLENLNGVYMREKAPGALIPDLLKTIARLSGKEVDADGRARLELALPGLQERATNLVELARNAAFLFAQRPLAIEDGALKLLTPEARSRLAGLATAFAAIEEWTPATIEACIRQFAAANGMKLGQAAQPLRAALTGSTTSPGIFDVLFALGQNESVARIKDQSL
ncbi:MAG: glutamate--tRNA ligase [Alphaproteobacteria bacterium]|nr:glutamate--tRNA ligase [Alphaproteobacteria bacterium]